MAKEMDQSLEIFSVLALNLELLIVISVILLVFIIIFYVLAIMHKMQECDAVSDSYLYSPYYS